jgi:hypothetical protein
MQNFGMENSLAYLPLKEFVAKISSMSDDVLFNALEHVEGKLETALSYPPHSPISGDIRP